MAQATDHKGDPIITHGSSDWAVLWVGVFMLASALWGSVMGVPFAATSPSLAAQDIPVFQTPVYEVGLLDLHALPHQPPMPQIDLPPMWVAQLRSL